MKLSMPLMKCYVSTLFNPTNHKALDLGFLIKYNATAPLPVLATADGYVTIAVNNQDRDVTSGARSYGNQVMIQHDTTLKTRSCHLAKGTVCVKVGQKVKRGQVIGMMGNTGYSFGRHLHFEVYEFGVRVNPFKYLDIPKEKMVKNATIIINEVPTKTEVELLKDEIVVKDGIIKALKEQILKIKNILG